jgi:antitoxin MazE5
MPQMWHGRGMSRVRISTTVDQQLLSDARRVGGHQPDSVLLDAALQSFLQRHRATELDEQYRAYDEQPLNIPDDWGDLASFRDAAAAS